LIINVDRFLHVSGLRKNYHEELKNFRDEIEKLNNFCEKYRLKKNFYKNKSKDIKQEMDMNIKRLEKDIDILREKVIIIIFLFSIIISGYG